MHSDSSDDQLPKLLTTNDSSAIPGKMRNSLQLIFLSTFVAYLGLSSSFPVSNLPKIDGEFERLDQDGKYLLDYSVVNSTITFQTLVETTGFVGFGLSTNGGMTGADIVIGGVLPNGIPYFEDRHGVGLTTPPVDLVRNWHLLDAWENATHTYLRFSRLLDTCDKTQDLPITRDTVSRIWSYGISDTIAYHAENRGVSAATMLDPPMPPFEPDRYQHWRMTVDYEMPAQDTTYYCTTQRGPYLTNRQHIVAFAPVLEEPDAVKHTHHFIVHTCRAPAGQDPDEYFRPYVEGPGGDCYNGPTSGNVPLSACKSYLFVWATGGKTMILPDHVGYPIGESVGYDYFMLEVHYDNPHELQGKRFESGLEIYYTDDLRPNEAGTLTLGHREMYSLTIPPNVSDFMVVGHCSSECSSELPAGGINVFNILLHSHLAGRKLKIRHYRDGEELPWLAVDDNYDFDFQQNRPLNPEGRILPGDHLTYECKYDSTVAKHTIIGGLSSQEEMCNTFLMYYPRSTLEICQTEFEQQRIHDEFGIESVYWPSVGEPVVLSPPSMFGKTYTEVLDTMIAWTPEYLVEFQRKSRYGEQLNRCISRGTRGNGTGNAFEEKIWPRVTYPVVGDDYIPPDLCAY